eukprot:gene223-biopygen314
MGGRDVALLSAGVVSLGVASHGSPATSPGNSGNSWHSRQLPGSRSLPGSRQLPDFWRVCVGASQVLARACVSALVRPKCSSVRPCVSPKGVSVNPFPHSLSIPLCISVRPVPGGLGAIAPPDASPAALRVGSLQPGADMRHLHPLSLSASPMGGTGGAMTCVVTDKVDPARLRV